MRSASPRTPPRPGRSLASVLVPVLILVAAWACLRVPAAAAQAKLLDNGSFAGSTAGWTCSSGDTVVTSPVYSGSSYSLAGTPTGSDDAQCSQVGPGLPRIRGSGAS
jgi:hypothetical protein